jgi:hypothetical protein
MPNFYSRKNTKDVRMKQKEGEYDDISIYVKNF